MYSYSFNNKILLLILIIWSLVWKGYALWTSAKHNHKKWFVVLLIFNTVGLLEIFYILYIVKKSWSDVRRDFGRALSGIGIK